MAIQKLLVLLLLSTTTSFAFSTTTTLTDYIRSSCASTFYPALCFTALVPYASSVQRNPIQLALVATNVSLSSVKAAAETTETLYQRSLATSATDPTTKALKDCKEVLSDAVDSTKYSMSQLNMLKGINGQQRQWILSNVLTYMSTTLTDEETCTDSLKDYGVVVNAVSSKVGNAKKYTSIALDLVYNLGYL